MQKSDSISNLAKALRAAQGQISGVAKNHENPYFKSKYADLADIWAAIKEPLGKNGLSIIQTLEPTHNVATVTTLLLHDSGEWVSSTVALTPTKSDPQGMGSAITYGRRYSLAAIVGLAAEEDDDGNAASQPPTKSATPPAKRPTPPKPGSANPPSGAGRTIASTGPGLLDFDPAMLTDGEVKSKWKAIAVNLGDPKGANINVTKLYPIMGSNGRPLSMEGIMQLLSPKKVDAIRDQMRALQADHASGKLYGEQPKNDEPSEPLNAGAAPKGDEPPPHTEDDLPF